jgi:DNA-binding MarR family transcriptional regulator
VSDAIPTPTAAVSDLETHIGFWLRMVSNGVSQAFARRMVESGVTVAEWVVLRQMYGRAPCTPSALAAELGLTRGAISKLVDRLLAKHLLTRQGIKKDRRYQSLALTAAGSKLVPQLAALADRNDNDFFGHLTEPERQELKRLLRKLAGENGLHAPPMS